MTTGACPGCGRAIDAADVSCPGCDRSLGQGAAVPPGWDVTISATSTLPGAPRWRLAGIDTARPTEPAQATSARSPAELFRPRPEDTVDLDPAGGGPGWRVRDRQPRALTWTPAAAAAAAVTVTRAASRMVYWALVGGILATSSAAVMLLALHMVRSR